MRNGRTAPVDRIAKRGSKLRRLASRDAAIGVSSAKRLRAARDRAKQHPTENKDVSAAWGNLCSVWSSRCLQIQSHEIGATSEWPKRREREGSV